MYDAFKGWSRLIASGFSSFQTGLRAYETLTASTQVIAARTAIIGSAMSSPLTADQAELGRMVPEKVDAFSHAGSVMVSAWWSGNTAWMLHLQHLGGMAARGRPPTFLELADLGDRTATLAVETIEAGSKLGSDSLAPLHRGATSNARRLRKTKSRRS